MKRNLLVAANVYAPVFGFYLDDVYFSCSATSIVQQIAFALPIFAIAAALLVETKRSKPLSKK
jgi:hypothetical protein